MLTNFKQNSVTCSMSEEETEHQILSFCTLCTLLAGKKLSFQNIFLLLLKDENYRNIFKELTDIDNDYEIVKLFIEYDSNIIKSKYVTRHINSINRTKSNQL